MASTVTAFQIEISDIFGDEKTLEQKYAALDSLTVARYIRWLKRNIRQYGRKAEFGNGRENAVEVFVREVTGIEIGFTASGEVEISGEIEMMLSGWTDLAYYTYQYLNGEDEEPVFVTTFGKALDGAMQAEAPFIVNWNFKG